ncbi:FAD/NAD(P)-binding domain-containing protein [Rhizodiscina lignyota]|uniref:FAD/NAD(P)-binding domain-containing protein n=1 Tax=Rhizodiscina lignyota TaxID=1504668 RepID=A0A9P4M3D7_9PEZI|nr:FAD/NAD(P)-binding domain-containing protein [Rhizodiscina lignyota]
MPQNFLNFLASLVSSSPTSPVDQKLAKINTELEKPNYQRTPAFPIHKLPGGLPKANVPEDVDVNAVAQIALDLVKSMKPDDLIEDALWRDLWAMTGTSRTFHSNKSISAAWTETAREHQPHDFKVPPGGAMVMRPGPGVSWVQVKYAYRTSGRPMFTGKGIIRVVPDSEGKWRIWLLISMLDQIPGFPSPDIMAARVLPGHNSPPPTPTSMKSFSDVDYDCVIIGGGMSGLCLAGHLQALKVRYVILDKTSKVGGNWTERYDSVQIHTSRGYGQFPFGTIWGPEYPYHLKTSHLADGYNRYVKENDINMMLSTTAEKTWFDEINKVWTLQLSTGGNVIYMRSRHIVMALGAGGQIPKMPNYPGKDSFKGTILHSKDYRSAKVWEGKRGIVIGSANTAHDITNDMLEAGCSSVTMIQRGATPVLPVECWSGIYDKVYKDDVPVSVSDSMMIPMPTVLQRAMSMMAITKYANEHKDFYDGLEKQGFKVDRYMDLYHCLYERFGGHYIEVGTSKKIIEGKIKVKSDSSISSFTENGLLFADGTTLDADVIVFATGFEGNMREAAEEIVGKEIGEKLDDWWGVDKEGELRGAWRPMAQPNIWFTGGNLGLARFYARYLAMQIKADVEGIPLKVYKGDP